MTVKAERFEVLDSLRGVCALGVALYHFKISEAVLHNQFYENLYVLVDYFFILSGFVIHLSYRRRLSTSEGALSFLIKRFGRVYPLYAAMLAFLVVMELAKTALTLLGAGGQAPFTGAYRLDGLVYSLALIQSLGFHQQGVWNTPGWSISTEWRAYVVYAGASVMAQKGRKYLLAAVAIISAFILIASGRHLMAINDVGIFRCLLDFIIGVGLAHVYGRAAAMAEGRKSWLFDLLESATVLAVLLAIALIPNHYWTMALLPMFAATVLLFAIGRGWLSTVLRQPPFLALGALSYSVYIINEPLNGLIHRVLQLVGPRLGLHLSGMFPHPGVGGEIRVLTVPDGWPVYAAYAAFAAVSIAIAWVTYRLIEQPGREYFRRRADRWAEHALAGELPKFTSTQAPTQIGGT